MVGTRKRKQPDFFETTRSDTSLHHRADGLDAALAHFRVLSANGAPIPGLYAAGEITGHFYGTAPNAVSVLREFVFGNIAGMEAVAYLRGGQA